MTDDARPPSIAWRPLAVVTAAVAVVLFALSGRYGYFRDELYFLACGRHLAWGYPDQPPLTPVLARIMNGVGHGSLTVFRLPAVAASAGVTLLSGLMARELGGGRFSQVLAAGTAATATYVLLSGHLLVTSTIDLLVWVVLTWLVLRILRTGDDWLWLVAGVVTGLGLINKQLPVVLVLGVLVGVLLTPGAQRLLSSRWLWAGVVVAAAAWTPVLLWQAQHGWPQLSLAGQIRAEYGTAAERANFLLLQVLLFSLGATYLWILGLVHLWRDPGWARRSARRSVGRISWRTSLRPITRSPRTDAPMPASTPPTTARRARSTSSGRPEACRRHGADTTAMACGARRRRVSAPSSSCGRTRRQARSSSAARSTRASPQRWPTRRATGRRCTSAEHRSAAGKPRGHAWFT